MSEGASLTLEQIQAVGRRMGITVGEELSVMMPLIAELQAALSAVDLEALRNVEPLLAHNTRHRGES